MPVKQLLDVPLLAGMNQKTDPRWLEPGQMTTVVNGVFAKKGAITKRKGTAALTKTLTSCAALLTYQGELIQVDGKLSLGSWSPTANAWQVRDQVSPCLPYWTQVAQQNQQVYDADVAEGNGYRIICWTGNAVLAGTFYFGDIFVTVIDIATGAQLYSGFAITSGGNRSRPKALVLGTTAAIVYSESTSTSFKAVSLDLTAPGGGWSAPTLLRGDSINGAFDVCPIVGNTTFVLAYESTGAAPTLQLYRYTSAFSQVAHGTVGEPVVTGFGAIAVRATAGESVWVGYTYTAAGPIYKTRATIHDPTTLAQATAPWDVQSTGTLALFPQSIAFERIDSTHAVMIAWSFGGVVNSGPQSWHARLTSNGTTNWLNVDYNIAFQSKPFAVNGRYYALADCGFTNAGSPQTTQFIVDLQMGLSAPGAPRVVGVLAPRFATTVNPRSQNSLSAVTNVGTTTASTYVTAGTVEQSAAAKGRTGITAITIDFAHAGRYLAAELGDLLYVGGGVPSIYDGALLTEHGFAWFPDSGAIGVTTNAAGGGLHGGGGSPKYSYQFLYEWVDARGNRQQSAPSNVVLVDFSGGSAAANQVTFTIPALNLTARQEADIPSAAKVGVVVYRTAYNAGAGIMGTTLFRITPDAIPTANLNDPTAQTISVTDLGTGVAADTAIVTNEILYTTGSAAVGFPEPSLCPPGMIAFCSHKGRLFGAANDQKSIYFTTAAIPGQPVRWTDDFAFSLEEGPGAVTALASMDDKLVVFKKRAIFVYTGDGPNELNSGGTFDGPYRVASDVGCVEPRSVALTSAGLLFLSEQGIYLLSRALEVSYVGHPVEDLLTLNPVITNAVVIPGENEVRFAAAPTATSSTGVVLVYNTLFGAWSYFTYWDTADTNTQSVQVAAAVLWNGRYTFATLGGQPYEETNPAPPPTTTLGAYLDGGSGWITLTVEWPWMKAGAISGFARWWRARVVLEALEGCNVNVDVATDYAPSYAQTASFTDAQLAAFATGLAEAGVHFVNQRAPSARVRFRDAPGAAPVSGQGFSVVGLTLELGVGTGLARVPAGQER